MTQNAKRTLAVDDVIAACEKLITASDALLDYMCTRDGDGQERKLEAAIVEARLAIARAKGTEP